VPARDFEKNERRRWKPFWKTPRELQGDRPQRPSPGALFKGGTFDSLETYADVAGIRYARNKMIKLAEPAKRLTIPASSASTMHAPELDLNEMGVVVMPFIDGTSVMAKQIFGHWEFGYCRDRVHRIQSEPYITRTPHDRRLVQLSKKIQECLKFRCEIEYIISAMAKFMWSRPRTFPLSKPWRKKSAGVPSPWTASGGFASGAITGSGRFM
jgi:hypothetical protein